MFARHGGNDDCFIEGDCFVVPPRNDESDTTDLTG
jgi:hypothetical protein